MRPLCQVVNANTPARSRDCDFLNWALGGGDVISRSSMPSCFLFGFERALLETNWYSNDQ